MHLLMTCGGLCLLHSLQFTFDFEPLLVTGKYFEFTSYFQQAECLLAYQEDCDIYVVQCFAKLLADIGQRERSRYSDSQRNGRSGDPIPRKAIFSAPVQTGLGDNLVPYIRDSGSFTGIKRPQHSNLALMLKKW